MTKALSPLGQAQARIAELEQQLAEARGEPWPPVPAVQAQSFVKYAGGKRQLVPELLKYVPKKYGTYWEPFVGGGALFFALKPDKAVLGDTNLELITTYRAIRDNVEAVINQLSMYTYDRESYEKARAAEPTLVSQIAARMIYLNRTGFNGLYRVNKAGKFNVPFGRYKNPTICQPERLRACSAALQAATINCQDYRTIDPVKGDFVYFDCPYMPVSKTSNFLAYTSGGFTLEDQQELAEFARKLKRRGVRVLLTNSPAARSLYKGFKIVEVDARRNINSKGSARGAVKELIIR